MSFALRYGPQDYPLGEGRFIIGRSESSQLCLDDPMASRNHAAITMANGVLKLEDLGSRNGVFLNQRKVTEPELLKHGDVIRIGGQEMTVVQRRLGRADTVMQRRVGRAETLAESPGGSTSSESFGLLGGLADKAIALGHGEEAERILQRHLERVLEDAENGELVENEELFEKLCHYAFSLTSLTRKGKWIDYLFRLHAAHGRLMDSELVNELYSMCSKSTGATRSALRAYVESLEPQAPSYSPGERFVLSRLEGLEKQL